jgi:hypothetical protein
MSEQRLSARASAILGGLIRSGKVHVMPPGAANVRHGYMRVERVGGGFYWLRCDGSVIRRGRDVTEAEALSDAFRDAMEGLGAPRRGLDVPPAPVKSCLASVA